MKCSKCDGTLVKIEEGLTQCTECGSKYRLRKPQATEQKPVLGTATTMISRSLKPKRKPVGLLIALIAAILLSACGILFWLFMREPLPANNAAKVLKKTGYTEMSADEILDMLESRVDSAEAYTYISTEADIKRFIDYSAPNATISSISYIKDMTVGITGDTNYCLVSYFSDFPSEDNAKDYVSDWISQSRPETILQVAAQYAFTEESYSAIKDSIHAVEGEKDKTSFYIIDVNIYGLQSTSCIYQRGKHVCTLVAADYNSTKGQRRLDDFCKEFDLVSPSEAKTIGTEVQLSIDPAISEGSSSEGDMVFTGDTMSLEDLQVRQTTPPSTRAAVVPSVIGQTTNDAKATLASQGFAVQLTESPSDSVPLGIVIRQNPEAGVVADPGTTVILEISAGKNTY